MKIKHLLLGMLAMAATVACNQEEPQVTPSLEVDKATATLAAEGGEVTIAVTSNVDWTASADQDWVSVDPASGKGSDKAASVIITAEPNEAEQGREATVTVSADKLTKTVKITQAAKVVEPTPVETTWGLMGMFVGNEWASDVPMAEEGDWIVAKEVEFSNLSFKIRANGNWDDPTNIGFAPGTEKGLVNAELSVVTAEYSKANFGSDAADIKLDGEPGTYDVYFSFENLKVYVMEQGYKPGEKEPVQVAPKEVSYTLVGTIVGTDADKKANYWNTSAEAGLMTLEGDYYVLRNVNLDYDYRFSNDGTGEDYVKFKITETGTWDSYGLSEYNVYQPNTEIPVQYGGSDIYFDQSGEYDVYFDKNNGKVWVMEPGYKPGEEPAKLDGYQWLLDMGDMQVICDFGLSEEGALMIAMSSEEGFVLYQAGIYEIDADDPSSGIIIFIPIDLATGEEGEIIEAEYSDLTATSVNIVAPDIFGSEDALPFTRVESPYEIIIGDLGGEEPEGVISDGDYWIFEYSNQVVMAPIAETAASARPGNGYIEIEGYSVASTVKNAFTFVYDADQTAYTIQDSYGRYLHSGYYNGAPSAYVFASATLPDGVSGYWSVTENGDGTYMILNMDTYYELAYDPSYSNWSLYDANHGKAYPTLIPAENPVEEPSSGPVEVTVAEFLAAAEDYTEYQLTGTIANVKNTDYGNFDLVDETGSVYIYGIVGEAGNKVFETLGLKEGDVLTVTGKRASYKGTPQMQNAVYVSHEAAATDDPNEVKTIFEGPFDASWDTPMNSLSYGGYDWSTVNVGDIIKIYGRATDPSSGGWYGMNFRTGEGWAAFTEVPDQFNTPTTVAVKITQTTYDELVAKSGFVVVGTGYTIDKIELIPASLEASSFVDLLDGLGSFEGTDISMIGYWGENGPSIALSAAGEGYEGGYALVLKNPVDGGQYNSWKAQAALEFSEAFDPTKTYVMSFYVKATASGDFGVQYQNASYSNQGGNMSFAALTDWVYVEHEFTTGSFDDIVRLIFNFGEKKADFYIDNFKFGPKN